MYQKQMNRQMNIQICRNRYKMPNRYWSLFLTNLKYRYLGTIRYISRRHLIYTIDNFPKCSKSSTPPYSDHYPVLYKGLVLDTNFGTWCRISFDESGYPILFQYIMTDICAFSWGISHFRVPSRCTSFFNRISEMDKWNIKNFDDNGVRRTNLIKLPLQLLL